ncbi:MAG: amino acid adenylation domain-containing protein [Clostridiales bacterium]|nr:amino acid adenylation domain-containing protein [Clostridiales bacterium]
MQIRNVLQYLENTVKRVPGKTAYEDGEGRSLTFAEVYEKSRAAGSFLAREGVYGEPVVIFMEKTPDQVAAFFGTVYGGCYYVPIDEEMPKLRTDLIIGTLKPKIMICDESTAGKAEEFDFDGRIVLWSEISKTPEDEAALTRIRDRQIDTDPIYIVFTSGSTGVPKGVIACHRSVIDYIENLSEVMGFNEDTVFGNQSPFYFDACLKELYPTIKFGAKTVIVPKQLFMFPLKLVEFLNEKKINTVCWVVSALTMISAFGVFDEVKPEYLKTVAFGSEVFPIKQFRIWRQAMPDTVFTNLYGPTEATGMSCWYRVDRDFEEGQSIPIGRPFNNTEIILLDDKDCRADEGEICIRGTAVTLGYYNNPEKTRESFVQNPLNDNYPEIIYRTGDIGRYNERGELEFISRKDYQIKHLGHRIELGEIEANVSTVDGIKSCCAVYYKEKDKICLYYVGDIEKADLSKTLKGMLPRYMLPTVITQLDMMPLTPNGKINRKYLGDKASGKAE